MRIFGLVLVLLPLYAGAAQAQRVIYVSQDAVGANDGTSWTDAFASLQDALFTARSGDEIWVAKGTYRPDIGTLVNVGDKAASFELIVPVSVYGGFAGGETVLTARDWVLNPTILSGDLAGNDPDTLAIDGPLVEDNSNNVVRVSSSFRIDPPVLDGFTITRGRATGPSSSDHGAGIQIEEDSHADLRNLTITQNVAAWAGGGISSFGTLSLRDSRVVDNHANRAFGGGIYLSFNADSDPVPPEAAIIDGVLVEGNVTGECGGGLFIRVPSSPGLTFPNMVRVTNTAFLGNLSEDAGGGVCVAGGAMPVPHATATFVNARFISNRTRREGAAGLLVEHSRVNVHNAVFSGNVLSETRRPGAGAIGIIEGSGLYMTHTTVVGNVGQEGDAMHISTSDVEIANSIFWDHSGPNGGFLMDSSPTLAINNSLIQGGLPTGATGTNILNMPPIFADPAMPGDDGLRLLAGSPGIDAGDTELVPSDVLDLDGDANIEERLPYDLASRDRVNSPAVDMGAYEYHSPVGIEGAFPGATRGCSISTPAPNPARGRVAVTIRLSGPAHGAHLEIWDVLGRQKNVPIGPLATEQEQRLSFDASPLPAGLYFLRVLSHSSQRCAVGFLVY